MSKLPSKKEVIERIQKEINDGRFITAFLLLHSVLESILIEILLYSNQNNYNKKIIKNIERLGLEKLITLHCIIGNISPNHFSKLIEINKFRNKIAHRLITYYTPNKKDKFRIQIKKSIKEGIEEFKYLYDIYQNKIEQSALRFLV